MIARFLGVRIWDLPKVAVHYQNEAAIILEGQYKERMEIAKKVKCSPEKVILPDF